MSQPTTSTFKGPDTPTIGGLSQFKEKEIIPWTGGKPNSDRTALDPMARKEPKFQHQLRPFSFDGQRSRDARVKFTGKQIMKACKISKLKKDLHCRFVMHGLDSITYLPDAKKVMRSVINESETFTKDEARKGYDNIKSTYDLYCENNDLDAATYLLNSLDPSLRREVTLFRDESDGFIVLWYELLSCLYSVNMEQTRAIENKIKATVVSQYPQQNLGKMIEDLLTLCHQLDDMDAYSHQLTYHMLKNLSYAGGGVDPLDPNTEDFRRPIGILKDQMDDAIQDTRTMSPSDADSHMKKNNLHFTQVLEKVKSKYTRLLQNGQWAPANSPLDTRTPASLQANVVQVPTSDPNSLMSQFQAFLLQQSNNNGNNNGNNNRNNRNWNNGNNNNNSENPKRKKPACSCSKSAWKMASFSHSSVSTDSLRQVSYSI